MAEYYNQDVAVIAREDVKIKRVNVFIHFICGLSIYMMAMLIILVDIGVWIYQNIYFRLQEIPMLKRSDYILMDRAELKKLTWRQKINCIYCEYANGVAQLTRDVVRQTEIYSCAIKHKVTPKGQDHQANFREREEFL